MSAGDARGRILHEATRLFGEKGYGSTSVRDVASASGVTNPALYYHFGSKEGLYLETVRLHQDALHARLVAAVEGEGDFTDHLRAFVQAHIDVAREAPSAARLLVYANHRPGSGEPRVDMMTVHQRSHGLLERLHAEGTAEGALRQDVSVDRLAMALTGQVILAWLAVLHGVPIPDDLAHWMVDTALRGVGA